MANRVCSGTNAKVAADRRVFVAVNVTNRRDDPQTAFETLSSETVDRHGSLPLANEEHAADQL